MLLPSVLVRLPRLAPRRLRDGRPADGGRGGIGMSAVLIEEDARFIGRVVTPFSPRHLLDAIAAAGAAPMESTAR